MRTLLALVIAVSLVGFCGGCATAPLGNIVAPLQQTKSALAMGDSSVPQTKVGEAKAEGIILVAFGDSSISTAMRNGGITRVHHVDSEEINVLGIYSRTTVKVYGD